MMWYVYCRHLSSGRDDCVNQTFETPQAAIKHIAKCYAIDKDLGQLGGNCYQRKAFWFTFEQVERLVKA